MKKIFIAVITIFLILLSSCSDAGKNNNTSNTLSSTSENVSEEMAYEVKEFSVKKEDMNIYGKMYIPKTNAGTYPAVILSHSANLTSDAMRSYCSEFAERGYIAYAFDFCGGSKKSRSDGEAEDMTVFTEVDDLKAVFAAISALDYVDKENIFLFGTSQGGLVSALAAEELDDLVKGLILLYPGFNIAEQIQSFYGDKDISDIGFSASGKDYIETLLDFDVYDNIGSYKGKVLILHGSKDFIVPSSYSEKAAELYEECELHIIEGAMHGFNSENYSLFGDYDEKVWEYIDAYLAKNAGGEYQN